MPSVFPFKLLTIFIVLVLLAACGGGADEDPPLVIAVASNALPALEEITREFEKRSGVQTTLSSGASGILYRQIRQGAGFDLFLSADDEYIQALAEEGIVSPGSTTTFALGQLVLVAARGISPPIDSIGDLADERVRKVSIANPAHAPYGRAAREALQNSGVWEHVEPRLVLGENVGQAFRFVTSGNAEAGLVPLSLAVSGEWPYEQIPRSLHQLIRQDAGMIVRSEMKEQAREFLDFLSTETAETILQRHGYSLPNEGGGE